MFANTLKTLLSKPAFTKPALKPTLFKAPFQGSIIQRSFARHFNKSQSSQDTIRTTSEPVQQTIKPEYVPPTGPSVDTIIQKDKSLSTFMSKIYRTTGLSIAGSLGLSYMIAASGAFMMSPGLAVFGGFAATIGGILAVSKIQPEITYEKGVEVWKNPLSRQVAFGAIIAGSGISLSPFITSLLFYNPAIIPMAAGLSVLTMGGASLYAMYKPLGHFKAWESTLTGTLFGLIGMNIVSLLLNLAIGPNIFSLACGKVDMYIGLGLFSAFQAFDTHTAVEQFREGNQDHLMHVVNFFLNFKNLFIRIASMLGYYQQD